VSGIVWKTALAGVFGAIACVAAPGSALAHPHVWVEVRSEFVFGADGSIAAVRHHWTFDDMYSSFAIQGLGKDGVPIDKALKALAKVNVTQLAEYGFFTSLKIGGKDAKFATAEDANITMNDKKIITLHFTAKLEKPVKPTPVAVLKVVDPTYFVAFDFAKKDPVTLASAPKGCSLTVVKPKPLTLQDAKRLEAVKGTNDSPGEVFGFKLATSAIAACP